MNKRTQAVSNAVSTLADDARALWDATSDVAGDRITEARKRLAAALETGKDMYGRARDKAAEGAEAVDEVVRENPYEAIGIAFGVGALVGFLVTRQCSRGH